MSAKPTYEELEYRLRVLENEARWRKEAEDALKESEERFKLLYEYAPDMYILCDTEGTLIDANRAAEKISGYERGEVVGKNLLSVGIIPENQVQKTVELLFKISEKIPTDPEEITIQRKDGSSVQIELRAYPVELAGRPIILTTARDISIHKREIEQISRREEKYRQTFETAPEPLFLFDARTTRIEDANQAARSFFGYNQSELIGVQLKDLLDGSAGSQVYLPVLTNENAESYTEISCTFRKKSNETVDGDIHFRGLQISNRHLVVGRISVAS